MIKVDLASAFLLSSRERMFTDFTKAFAEYLFPGESGSIVVMRHSDGCLRFNLFLEKRLSKQAIINSEWLETDEKIIKHHSDLVVALEDWAIDLPRVDRKARVSQFFRR